MTAVDSVASDVDLVGGAVRDVLRARCDRAVVDAAEAAGWAPDLWSVVASGGFPWVSVPESAGGPAVGGSVAEACAVLEQVGRYAAPLPVGETGLLGGWLLASAGLPIPSGPVTTSPGSSVVLRRAGASLVADGLVTRVPWARVAERIVLLADSPDGPMVVSVEPSAVAITPGTNLAGEPRDTVHLDGVPVEAAPAPDGVDHDGLRRRGALSRAALIAGAAGRVLELTVGYTNERHQFGRPVARFQAVSAHLVRLAEQTESARMAARSAAVNAGSGTPDAFDAAAAKTVTSSAAGLVAAAAHQATGAMGMTREYELGVLTRRLYSWRDEYGGERAWSVRLGTELAAGGAGGLWPSISRGVRG